MSQADPFLSPLGGLSPDEWSPLAGDRLYSSCRWLRLCGSDAQNPAGAVYLGGSRGHGEEAAGVADVAVPVAAITKEPNPFYRWRDELTRRGLPSPAPEGILVGPHRGYQTHILSPSPRPASAVEALLARLTTLPRETAEAGLLGDGPPAEPACMAMFLTTADAEQFRKAGVGTAPVLLKADAWIRVPEGGWPAWLASLPGRRRELVRREMRRFAGAGYRVVETTLTECAEVAGRLLSLTEARYGHSTTPEQHAVSLARQAAVMGAQARVLLCLRGSDVIGYCCYYICGSNLYLRSAGFDHSRTAEAAEYFNLVYYLPIQKACEAGVRWVHAGIEATEAKALRGAELRPLWLLDLSERSVLRGLDAEISACNARFSTELAASSAAIATAMRPPDRGLPDQEWEWGWRAESRSVCH